MIRENRECVTIRPFLSFSGDIGPCHVIFKGKGLTGQMAPREAVEKIKHLLVSTSENGSQDHKTLLAAYKKFDAYLTEKNIERPVVILSDGHSSRFDLDVMLFLRSRQMRLYITWPDTTALLQLLDQVNQSLHTEYRKTKAALFTQVMTINREGFMMILAELWSSWTSKESLINAARRVGVTPTCLDVSMMQKEKFLQAVACVEGGAADSQVASLATTPSIESPKMVRHGSREYYKTKFESLLNKYENVVGNYNKESINIAEVPGLLKVTTVKPKITKENVRVTQVHGSMEGKYIISKVAEIKEAKEAREKSKEKTKTDQQHRISTFHRCKMQCTCDTQPCQAKGLRECSHCHNILKSVCSRTQCRQEDGSKPPMIKPSCEEANPKPKKKLQFAERSDDSEDGEDEEDMDVSSLDEDSEDDSILQEDVDNEENYFEAGVEDEMPSCSETAELTKIPIDEVKEGEWVKVKFEEQLFIGKVEASENQEGKKRRKFVRVRCLELPYPIRKPQGFEKGRDACDYTEVYHCIEKPKLVADGRRVWKWLY